MLARGCLLLLVAGLAACDDAASLAAFDEDGLAQRNVAPGDGGLSLNLPGVLVSHARLLGEDEVPVAVDTEAGGNVIVRESLDGDSLRVVISTTGLEDILFAHIHCNVEGQMGPIGVTLFHPMQPVTVDGLLVRGWFEPDPGNSCGWQDAGDVLEAIEAGGAYVNVHTLAHPAGELRGQL